MILKKYSIIGIALICSSISFTKDTPRKGYVTNYSIIQDGWRFYNYLSGHHNRKQDILDAIRNNDQETFKRNFMKGDLVDNPDIVIEIIQQNKLELLQLVNDEYELDINTIIEYHNAKTNHPNYVFLRNLFEKHGADAIPMKNFLKSIGLSINVKNNTGQNLGYLALEKNDLELLKEFLSENDISINDIDANEDTLLHTAAHMRDSRCFRTIVQLQPNIDQRNNQGETPFFIAARHDDSEKLALLSEKNANVNIANNEGITPGHLAAAGNCSVQSAKIIFESNMNPNYKNNEGHSIKQVLKEAKFRECVKKIKKVSDKEKFVHYKKRCNHFLALEALFINSRIQQLNEETKKIKEEHNKRIAQETLLGKERLAQQEQQLIQELARIEHEKSQLEDSHKEKQAELKDLDELEKILAQDLHEHDNSLDTRNA